MEKLRDCETRIIMDSILNDGVIAAEMITDMLRFGLNHFTDDTTAQKLWKDEFYNRKDPIADTPLNPGRLTHVLLLNSILQVNDTLKSLKSSIDNQNIQVTETLKSLKNSIDKQSIFLSELVGAVEDLDDFKARLKGKFTA